MAEYNILLSTDNKYLPYAFVTCQSVIDSIGFKDTTTSNSENDRDTLVFTFAIDDTVCIEEVQSKSDCFVKRNSQIINIKFNFKLIDASLFNNGKQLNNSYSTYYRIIIDKIFDESIDIVLYLDCDILVRQDIRSLFLSTDIKNSVIAGVRDAACWYHYSGKDFVEFNPKNHKNDAIKLDLRSYINAGVLLINLKEYRKHDISHRCFSLLETHNFSMHDQDLLNIAVKNKSFLDLTWNFLTAYYFNSYNSEENIYSNPPNRGGAFISGCVNFKYNNNIFIKTSKDPAICHFTDFKPWQPVDVRFSNLPFNDELSLRLKEWYITADSVVEFSDRLNSFKYSDLYNHSTITCIFNKRISNNEIAIHKYKYKHRHDVRIIFGSILILFIIQITLFIILLLK